MLLRRLRRLSLALGIKEGRVCDVNTVVFTTKFKSIKYLIHCSSNLNEPASECFLDLGGAGVL